MPPIRMELSRIVISEINDQQVIFLQEVDGDRTFPIVGLSRLRPLDR